MAYTSGDWTISNCGDFIEANGELICQGFDKTEENFPNWEGNRGVLVAAPELLTMLKETAAELDAIMDQKGHTAQTRAIRDRAYALTAKVKGEQ